MPLQTELLLGQLTLLAGAGAAAAGCARFAAVLPTAISVL